MNQPVFRFAPSPNGLLHLGHAYSALLNLRFAREAGGRMLLRIEDLDTQRCTPVNERMMLEDLEWLGFEWDAEPRRQSRHSDEYGAAMDALMERSLAYPSAMSRAQIRRLVEEKSSLASPWPCDPDGVPHYPGRERELDDASRESLIARGDCIIRLDGSKAVASLGREYRSHGQLSWHEQGNGPQDETGRILADALEWGDIILGRRDAPGSYHLCCILDDALQGITHIVRGRDLFHATSIQRLLQELFGLSVPTYHHHDLVLDEDGRKLSKSRASTALRHLREAGASPSDIRRIIGLE
ncbi:MAG: tRNA glutamyl-Q(34) synthetase GluQRS [Rhizobiaceae bacterium]